MKHKTRTSPKKAIVLFLAIFLIITMVSISTPLLSRVVSDTRQALRHSHDVGAFWLAEAGVQRAISELNQGDGNWSGWTDNSGTKKKTETLGDAGDYDVIITDPESDTPNVSATGAYPDINDPQRTEKTIYTALDSEPVYVFKYAAFGDDFVHIQGHPQVDSYNSCEGDYNPANPGANGDVGTNGDYEGAVELQGGPQLTIQGDVYTGLGGNVVNKNSTITGEIFNTADESLPPVRIPESLESLSNGGDVNYKNTVTLDAGSYKYSSLAVTATGIVTISGDVTIYVTSDDSNALELSGGGQIVIQDGGSLTVYTDGPCYLGGNGILNASGKPENLIVYSTYAGDQTGITIIGNTNTYGAFYAPQSEVKQSGDGQLFGSLIGRAISIQGNGNVHFDECLSGYGDEDAIRHYVMTSWREKYNPFPLENP